MLLLYVDVCATIVQTSAFFEQTTIAVYYCMRLTRSLIGLRDLCYCM